MKRILPLMLMFASFVQAQTVTIPDPAFKALLLSTNTTDYIATNNGSPIAIDANSDGEVQQTEALMVTGLVVIDVAMSDATGLEAFTNLEILWLYNTNITALSLAPLVNLKFLRLNNCPITAVDFSGLPNLISLDCWGMPVSELDFSNNPEFISLTCESNPNLTYINLKNGNPLFSADMFGQDLPSLALICVDDADEALLVQQHLDSGEIDAFASPYCGFVPGGDYNTISGTIRFDADANGCDASDPEFPYIRVNIDDGIAQEATFTNADGQYTFYTGAGTFNLSVAAENPSWFAISPAAPVSFPDDDNHFETRDFCVTAVGTHADVEVTINTQPYVVSGNLSSYQLILRNLGNQMHDGSVVLSYDESLMDYFDAGPSPFEINPGSVTFLYVDLQPFETRYFNVTVELNTPASTPPLNTGDFITLSANVTLDATDENPANNTSQVTQEVVASFDPNNKVCLEGDVEPAEMIGEYLHYNINFKNTGSAPAMNVVVKDSINPAMYDRSTLQIMGSSHAVEGRLSGNVAEFIFQNINLEIGGHGNILLKIKTLPTLTAGSEVMNRADIFFDYNPPVDTGVATTLFQSLGVGNPGYDASVAIYPNPANDVVRIAADSTILSVELYDIQGRILATNQLKNSEFYLHLSERTSGIYIVKVTTHDGVKVDKLIKN